MATKQRRGWRSLLPLLENAKTHYITYQRDPFTVCIAFLDLNNVSEALRNRLLPAYSKGHVQGVGFAKRNTYYKTFDEPDPAFGANTAKDRACKDLINQIITGSANQLQATQVPVAEITVAKEVEEKKSLGDRLADIAESKLGSEAKRKKIYEMLDELNE